MNQANAKLYSINEIPMLYKRLFGGDLDIDDILGVVDGVLIATGTRATKHYLFKGNIVDFELNLPCNVYAIKHVCESAPSSYYAGYTIMRDSNLLLNYMVDPSGNAGAYNVDATSINVIEPEVPAVYEVNKNIFTVPLGIMIPFENDNNCCLSFNHKSLAVDVLYTGTVVDENGYPKVTEKTKIAIAYFMNYIAVRKRFNMKLADANMLNLAMEEKDQKIANARTPDAISQNEEDELFNVMTSSNRKRHNMQHRR